MKLTIWRHGEADAKVPDRLRELTGSGEDDVSFGCQQFHRACHDRGIPDPDVIVYSPWLRTAQTADIIAATFPRAAQSSLEALQPGSDIQAVDNALLEHVGSAATVSHILLVSHQPLVSRLIEHYLGEGGSVPWLSPGGLACMHLEVPAPACGKLLFWAVPPEYEVGL